ncbi:4-alpha-glucanotransferase [Janthinobacterium sp. 17J80-10]|uniref:4-alpha-glucanotransferase n=1 Tax=Janthinobacterium sp. 17J80-10 TaxID=2497863 RepID=UPI0010057BEE|nr:4-alpha-glucanotransferase [Janthinobacterium sp. 17J80-10]QAU34499.1 4-alpha-glucanotransferase [Janthinobacterium sp. 17J80-10]
MIPTQILTLARAAGLEPSWTNAFGEPREVGEESLRTILEALGYPCASESQYRDSMARLDALQNDASLPALLTATAGKVIHLGAAGGTAGNICRIDLESGAHIEARIRDDGKGGGELEPVDEPGYHQLHIGGAVATLAVAPQRCFGVGDAVGKLYQRRWDDPRLWGLGVQLYSLRRAGDGGVGDFTALATLAQAAARQGAAALAISPVHAMFSADVTRFSPYGPSSRLFLNALHIDPAAVLGQDAMARALAELGPDAAARYAALEEPCLIDWPAAAALRLALLRRLYERFIADAGSEEFEAFVRKGGRALQDHVRFETLHAWQLDHGGSGDWRTWAGGLRDPRSMAVTDFAREHERETRFHEFLQWQAARGLGLAQQAARAAGMPIGLITDLAVGADNDGSQAWSRQGEIINGLSVGAPPDVLNTRGQSWGLGAFSPLAMKAKGFGAYIEMLRATFAYAGGARIDHALGLGRMWLVPAGASPEQGGYLRYPMQDLLRLIALESWRHRAIVIGEDLGTVPPGFDVQLSEAGLLGIRVLLFQQQNGRFLRPDEWPKHAIATTTTHDLPTIAGWWQGHDITLRTRLDLLMPGQSESDARLERSRERDALQQAMHAFEAQTNDTALAAAGASVPLDTAVAFVAATPAPLAMLPIEDALGLVEQPNLPGTIDSHPNWRRRLPLPVEKVLDEPQVASRLAILNKTRTCKEKP